MNATQLIFCLLICPFLGWSQIPRPDDVLSKEKLRDKKVKSYEETWTWFVEEDSIKDSRVMEKWYFNKTGSPMTHWQLAVDFAYSIDSTIYKYDSDGRLSQQTNYRRYIPKKKNAGGFYDLPLTPETVVKDYVYNKGQLQFIITHNDKALKKHDTAFYEFDKEGRMILSDDRRSKTTYEYKDEQLSEKKVLKKIHVRGSRIPQGTFSDTVITTYVYKEDILAKEESKENTITYVYNEDGQMMKAFERGTYRDKPYEYNYDFSYDKSGNLVEMKKFKEGVLWDWERYEYNEKGLPVKLIWINVETKIIEIQVRREYQYH